MAKRPVSALGNRRPISDFAKVSAAVKGNPRFKGENILEIDLDMPNRTTRDYEGPAVAPRVQAALDAALQDEEDLDIDGSPSLFSSSRPKSGKRKEKASSRPRTAKKTLGVTDPKFPSTRGLVPK